MTETNIFDPIELGGIRLNNRILRAATHEGMADDNGCPTDRLTSLYVRLARGGIGGIITGFIAVSKDGAATNPGMCILDEESKVPAFSKMTAEVHEAGAPIIAQLVHCGQSGVMGKAGRPEALSKDQIKRIAADFRRSAVLAKKAGFDGIELHIAHGYLLSALVSSQLNHRRDEYGGNTENKYRIIHEIMQGIRGELPDYPVYAKINGTEKSAHGIRIPEAVKIAGMLENDGVSAIEVSSNTFNENLGPDRGSVPVDMILAAYPGIKDLPGFVKKIMPPIIRKLKTPDDPQHLYNVPAAKAIRQAVRIPVIVCGGIRYRADMEKVIGPEQLDAVSLCRPLILEADLVNKYKTGKTAEPKCTECNYCIMGILENPLRCYYGKVPKK